MKHPIQNVVLDENGTPRFVANKIVRYLLDNGPFDLNHIARNVGTGLFDREDMEQFSQLIGYSVSGFSELSWVSDEAYDIAEKKAENTT